MPTEEAIYWVGVFTLEGGADWRERLDCERYATQQADERGRFLALAFKDIRDNAMPPVLYHTAVGQRIHGIISDALRVYEQQRREAA